MRDGGVRHEDQRGGEREWREGVQRGSEGKNEGRTIIMMTNNNNDNKTNNIKLPSYI